MSLKTSLRKIIYAHQTGKQEQFVEGVREIIIAERKRGHNRVADDLEKALSNANRPSLIHQPMQNLQSPVYTGGNKALPVSKGDNLPLLEVKYPKLSFDDVVLNDKTQNRVNRIVNEQTARLELGKYGLEPISKILFYGAPGCGKTLTAYILASVLGWSLLYTRFDSVISSYLGETSINLRKVFDFASQTPSILFFDEFDAIGKSREEQRDVGELKRVVNTFLQMLDNYKGKGLIIAATNHETLLDHALWRRFDEVIHFKRPTSKETEKLLKMRLSGVRWHDFMIEDIADRFYDLSYSDITQICLDSLKRMVLDNRASLMELDILTSLSNYRENRPSA